VRGYRLVVAVGLVLATMAACGGAPPIPTLTVAGVERRQPAADAPIGDVARALTTLGYQLETTAFPSGANSVMSPLSIGYAFAMARAGAGGETAAQLDRVLGFPSIGLHDAFNAITRKLVTADAPPAKPDKPHEGAPRPSVVCVGEALFPQQRLAVGDQFLRTLAAQYGVGVHPVDFGSGKATDVINEWVRQQTAGRVKKLFDSVSPDTKLVLANTVYLRADWARQLFAENRVTPLPFTKAGGDTVSVPMMHADDDLRYAADAGWQAVEVPFADGQLAMRILLPAQDQPPASLLAPATMAAVSAALQPQAVDLTLPRWDFASDLDLRSALAKLGLTLPFGGDADFGGISPGLHIEQAVHRANITVDEWGTEAAAVTGLSFPTAGKVPAKNRMTVDRPFAFAVMHTETGVPLFVGQVTDPSAH
jgi:serine protease inhibitor